MREITDEDLQWLRFAFSLADRSVDGGDQPYGAVLVGTEGTALVEGMNTRATSGDATGHAELHVVREASKRWPREFLAACTLYSSAEPCPMCAGAIGWSGPGRLVFGLSKEAEYALGLSAGSPRFADPGLPRAIFEALVPPIEVHGPVLEEEASRPHLRWAAKQHHDLWDSGDS
jgi:tRNA(Arg) A34 adenosine deaminase TadA